MKTIKGVLTNIYFYLNIIILLVLMSIVISYQKYSCLYEFEYFWSYNLKYILEQGTRIVPSLISHCYTALKFLSSSVMDFKSGYGSYITSFIYMFICCIFAKGFFIFQKEKVNFFQQKSLVLPICISFLVLTLPIYYLFDNSLVLYFMNIDEFNHFSEYFIGYIFLFSFYAILFNKIANGKKYNLPTLIFISILCIITGSYNEICCLCGFFTNLFLIIYFFIFNRELIKNKELITITCSFFLGNALFLILGDYLKGNTVNTINFDLFGSIMNSFSHFDLFVTQYIKYVFIKKIYFWLAIIALSIFLYIRKDYDRNKTKNIIIISACILLAYLATCSLEILTYNFLSYCNFVFERNFDNCFQTHLFEFLLIVLTGFMFFNSDKKIKFTIIVIYIAAGILLSSIFYSRYTALTQQKLETKLMAYRIEKAATVYSMLGESVLVNAKYTDNIEIRRYKIFPLNDRYNYSLRDDFSSFLKDKYFDASYSFYSIYYDAQYKTKFIGFRFVDDSIADSELQKRLELFDDKIETDDEIIKNKIKFRPLQRYGNRILTLRDIENIEKKHGKSDILLKAKAYINYRNNKYDEAIKQYNEYLKIYPNDFDALINLAEMYKYYNDYTKAKEIYKKLLTLDDNNLTFRYNYLTILYSIDKNYAEALKICNSMIDIEPEMVNNHINQEIISFELFWEFNKNNTSYKYRKPKELLPSPKWD